MPEFLMVKELEPMLEKLLLMDPFKASMDVKIPTRAMIPKAMIRMVRTVRSICPRMADKAIFTFSRMVTLQK
jgi:hypothetical protein